MPTTTQERPARRWRSSRSSKLTRMRGLEGLQDTEKLKWQWAKYHSRHFEVLVINNSRTCNTLMNLTTLEQSSWCDQFPLQIPRETCHWKSYTSAPCVCAVADAAAAGPMTDADADDS